MDDMATKLQRMQEVWASGKDTPPGPPDGVYEFQLQGVELKESAASGKLTTLWEFMVVGGEYEGQVCRDVLSLEMESGPYRIGQRLKKLGIEIPEDITELPEAFELLSTTNPIVRGRLRHSGDFINVTIQELLDAAPQPTAVTGTPTQAPPPAQAKVDSAGIPIKEEAAISPLPFKVGTKVSIQVEGKKTIATVKSIDRKVGQAILEDDENIYEGVPFEDITVEPIATVAPPLGPPPSPPPPDAAEKQALLEFCQAQGLEDPGIDATATVQSLVAILQTYVWDPSELTEGEATLLTKHGVELAVSKKVVRKKK